MKPVLILNAAAVVFGLAGLMPIMASNCEPEIGNERPRIYVATFLVPEGKNSLGDKVSDNIAQKFINDGRFEVIPRGVVSQQMRKVSEGKMATAAYLELAMKLATQNGADCVVFGKVTRNGNDVTFLVRMASVSTGENRRKVDETMPRTAASDYFDNLGDSLVSYFSAPSGQISPLAELPAGRGGRSPMSISLWGGYNWIYVDAKTRDTLDLVDKTTGGKSTVGGVGGGADVWLRTKNGMEIGGGIAYLPLYSYKYSSTSGGSTTTFDYDVSFLPAAFQLRFLSASGLYAGAGVAYFVGMASAKVTVDGLTAQASTAGSTLGLVGLTGWQIQAAEKFGINLGTKLWLIPEDGGGWSLTPFAGFFVAF
ncbi:MAG: hypothetical protein ACOY5B_11765 [Spirochaetota bacterium]